MAKNLVIVESPAKARTLGKYLGRNYLVKASIGHVMDLPKSKLGVDVERDFAPEYHVIQGKAKVLEEIKKAAKDKENVYLAPDPDREGEAIAWHIAQKLGARRKNVHRVLFNEITKKAVLAALKTPGKLDQNRFDAQQARRILDRLVGYKLSPLLWDKVRRGLSAGRVQSVAVRIICEREREIRAFTPEEYWTVEAPLEADSPRIAGEALAAARDYIQGRYGAPYLPESPQVYRSKKDAQDAHEAIRPTAMDYEPERVASYLDKDELALYTLIWNRFVASQMESAVYDATAVDIEAGTCRFRATGQILKFDGFIRVYTEGRDDEQRDPEEVGEGQLPPLAEGDRLRLLELVPEQHFTQPPPRFTQATLVKELEEKGIGRPSTYASIVGTILNKEYVLEDDQRRLKPTELGFLVTDLLVEAFPDVLNVEFTAGMEDQPARIE